LAICESIDSDTRKQRERKAKEEAAGDDTKMEEDIEEEDPVPEITRLVNNSWACYWWWLTYAYITESTLRKP
jgi:hypothetical protein